MVEFIIKWGDSSQEELAEVIRLIREAGFDDAHVTVVGPSILTGQTESKKKQIKGHVPESRLKQIIKIIMELCPDGSQPVTKEEIVSVMAAKGISALTASVYVSNAGASGMITRLGYGYVVTEAGRELVAGET